MFEIWEIANDGFELIPMFLHGKYESFGDAYVVFISLIKEKPCCIIANLRSIK